MGFDYFIIHAEFLCTYLYLSDTEYKYHRKSNRFRVKV